jgi:hypothetical protein
LEQAKRRWCPRTGGFFVAPAIAMRAFFGRSPYSNDTLFPFNRGTSRCSSVTDLLAHFLHSIKGTRNVAHFPSTRHGAGQVRQHHVQQQAWRG